MMSGNFTFVSNVINSAIRETNTVVRLIAITIIIASPKCPITVFLSLAPLAKREIKKLVPAHVLR